MNQWNIDLIGQFGKVEWNFFYLDIWTKEANKRLEYKIIFNWRVSFTIHTNLNFEVEGKSEKQKKENKFISHSKRLANRFLIVVDGLLQSLITSRFSHFHIWLFILSFFFSPTTHPCIHKHSVLYGIWPINK